MNEDYKNLDLYKYWKESKLHSTKGNSFFNTYEELFSKYRKKKITFVEIGVKWGGSLFMWRDYFGENARIIGVDLYPKTKELEKYGFEIFIGNQSSEQFWKNFFSEVGSVDIILDDGGHTNENQILTLNHTLNNVNDNGIIVIEDVFSSYDKKFNNPSKYSFINYSKFLIDDLNGRVSDKLQSRLQGTKKKNSLNKKIHSIQYFTNFVAFFIDRRKCIDTELFMNREVNQNPSEIITEDFVNPRRFSQIYSGGFLYTPLIKKIRSKMSFLKKISLINYFYKKLFAHRMNKKLFKFFK